MKINVNDVAKEMKLEIKVIGKNSFTFRLWACKVLLGILAIVSPFKTVVDFHSQDPDEGTQCS